MCGKASSGKALHGSRAHCALGRTLPDRQNIPIKTTDRPRRTLRPFISPSVGWFLRSSPACPSFFPETRCAAPACEIALESCDVASRERPEAAEPTGKARADRGDVAARRREAQRDHGFGPAAETWTNSPSDCGAMADRSRTATDSRCVVRRLFGWRAIDRFSACRSRDEKRRLCPRRRIGGRHEDRPIGRAVPDKRDKRRNVSDGFRRQRTMPVAIILVSPRPGIVRREESRRSVAVVHLAQESRARQMLSCGSNASRPRP